MSIFKLVTMAEWRGFQQTKIFHGTSRDVAKGFICCSLGPQIAEVWRKRYCDAPSALLLLHKVDYKLEGGWPHVFRPLVMNDLRGIMWIDPLQH